jgi:hypothetical protein
MHEGIIQPGTEVQIPILISALRTGQISLLGLLLASSSEEDQLAIATIERSFDVQPVASCSTSVRSARVGNAGYLVGVEVRANPRISMVDNKSAR